LKAARLVDRVRTDDKRAVEIQRAEVLVGRLVEGFGRLLVHAQHRLFTIPLDVHQVPEVVVQWIGRLFLQDLDAVTNVKPKLDDISN